MKFNAIAWNAQRTPGGRGGRFRKSEYAFRTYARTFVEISIRHNGFHVDSFRFASSRYILFALPKNRLTGSNPMWENRYFPHRPLFFCGSSFRASMRPSKSTRGQNFREANRGKREPDAQPFAYDFDRAPRARAPDVPRSGKSSSRLDSFAYHRFPILTIKFYRIPHVFIYTFQEWTVTTWRQRNSGSSNVTRTFYICKL